jgi:uncharacterized membrane protein YcfT
LGLLYLLGGGGSRTSREAPGHEDNPMHTRGPLPDCGQTSISFNLHFLLVQICNIVSERFFDDFSETTPLKHRFFMFFHFLGPHVVFLYTFLSVLLFLFKCMLLKEYDEKCLK